MRTPRLFRPHRPFRLHVALLSVLALTATLVGACSSGQSRTQPPTTVAPEKGGAAPTSKFAEQVATVTGTAPVPAYAEATTTSKQVATFGPKTNFGSPRVFLVVPGQPKNGLVQVHLPMRPNGTLGWIPQTAIKLGAVPFELQVDRNAKTLTLYKGGNKVDSWPVAVGTGGTPTPDGTFYVTDLIKPPNAKGPYGPFAYGLSGYSEVLDNFNGGDGQIGIHGTNNADSIGKDASHGCIRMQNDAITQLATTLPLGTPVIVS